MICEKTDTCAGLLGHCCPCTPPDGVSATVVPNGTIGGIIQLYYTPEAPSSQESSGTYAMASNVAVYTVRAYKGHIGIFLNESESPFEELDVDLDLLPEADQILLREGIRVTDRDRLNRLIEDYES